MNKSGASLEESLAFKVVSNWSELGISKLTVTSTFFSASSFLLKLIHIGLHLIHKARKAHHYIQRNFFGSPFELTEPEAAETEDTAEFPLQPESITITMLRHKIADTILFILSPPNDY